MKSIRRRRVRVLYIRLALRWVESFDTDETCLLTSPGVDKPGRCSLTLRSSSRRGRASGPRHTTKCSPSAVNPRRTLVMEQRCAGFRYGETKERVGCCYGRTKCELWWQSVPRVWVRKNKVNVLVAERSVGFATEESRSETKGKRGAFEGCGSGSCEAANTRVELKRDIQSRLERKETVGTRNDTRR